MFVIRTISVNEKKESAVAESFTISGWKLIVSYWPIQKGATQFVA
jgi:hypothetical protein